jgi:exoribonuclease II
MIKYGEKYSELRRLGYFLNIHAGIRAADVENGNCMFVEACLLRGVHDEKRCRYKNYAQ